MPMIICYFLFVVTYVPNTNNIKNIFHSWQESSNCHTCILVDEIKYSCTCELNFKNEYKLFGLGTWSWFQQQQQQRKYVGLVISSAIYLQWIRKDQFVDVCSIDCDTSWMSNTIENSSEKSVTKTHTNFITFFQQLKFKHILHCRKKKNGSILCKYTYSLLPCQQNNQPQKNTNIRKQNKQQCIWTRLLCLHV